MKWFCLSPDTSDSLVKVRENRLPPGLEMHPKGAVKFSAMTRVGSLAGRLALGCLLLAAVAQAQAPKEPPTSSMVSDTAVMVESIKPDPSTGTDSSSETTVIADPASLLPDLPVVPRKNATMVGGTIARLDRVRDRVTLNVFGGSRTTALFDPRTKVYRGSQESTIADLREGDRVYLDTILDGSTVFARTIRIKTGAMGGESQGVVINYSPDHGEFILRDGISPNPVHIRLSSATRFVQGDHSVPPSTLLPGSLVAVAFDSEGNGHDIAREIKIQALPGASFTFTGQVMHIDLRSGLLVLNSSTDHKTYEVYLGSSVSPQADLHAGVDVTVVTHFEDSRYIARSLSIQNK